MRLIDADALKAKFINRERNGFQVVYHCAFDEDILNLIDNAPTITEESSETKSDYLDKVAVSPKLAKLPSTLHRDIPKTFTKSNDLNDLIFYDEEKKEDIPQDILRLLPAGTTIFSPEEFINNFSFA